MPSRLRPPGCFSSSMAGVTLAIPFDSSQSSSNSPSPYLSARGLVQRELRVVVQAEVASEGQDLVHEQSERRAHALREVRLVTLVGGLATPVDVSRDERRRRRRRLSHLLGSNKPSARSFRRRARSGVNTPPELLHIVDHGARGAAKRAPRRWRFTSTNW
jgi:hypothetical protein